MSLGKRVKNASKPIIANLFADEDFITTITWKVFSESAFDQNLGYNVDTYVEHSVDVIMLDPTRGARWGRSGNFPIGADAGGVEYGTEIFLVKTEDAPSGHSIRDVLVDGTKTYRPTRFKPVLGHDFITVIEVEGVG